MIVRHKYGGGILPAPLPRAAHSFCNWQGCSHLHHYSGIQVLFKQFIKDFISSSSVLVVFTMPVTDCACRSSLDALSSSSNLLQLMALEMHRPFASCCLWRADLMVNTPASSSHQIYQCQENGSAQPGFLT